jgi:hypothetical protein
VVCGHVVTLGRVHQVLCHIYDAVSNIEHHLASGASEKIQLAALVGAFVYARHMMGPPE